VQGGLEQFWSPSNLGATHPQTCDKNEKKKGNKKDESDKSHVEFEKKSRRFKVEGLRILFH